jgi:hypothetical protein
LGNSFGRHLLTRAGPPDHEDLRQDRSAAFAGDSAFRAGAPRSMKMGSIVLPWRHDYDAENMIEATLRCGRHHTRPAYRLRHPRKSAARCGQMAFDCTQTTNATFPVIVQCRQSCALRSALSVQAGAVVVAAIPRRHIRLALAANVRNEKSILRPSIRHQNERFS